MEHKPAETKRGARQAPNHQFHDQNPERRVTATAVSRAEMFRGMCDQCESHMEDASVILGTHKKSTEEDPVVESEIAFAGKIRTTKQGIEPTPRGASASTKRAVEKLPTSNSSNA